MPSLLPASKLRNIDAPPLAVSDQTVAAFASDVVVVLCGAILLMLPSFLNGGPFIFADTATHFAYGTLLWSSHPADAVVMLQNDPGLAHKVLGDQDKARLLQHAMSYLGVRSVLYSVLLERSIAWGSIWSAAYLQALFVSASMRTALGVVFGRNGFALRFLLLCAALTATPANITVNLLLPDSLAAGMILLIVAAVFGWSRLTRIERTWCMAGVSIAILCHLSHAPIAFLTGAAAAIAAAFRAKNVNVSTRPALSLGAVIIAAVAIASVLDRAAAWRMGMPVYRLPLLVGRVIDDGPGRQYLAAKCERSTYRLCEFKDRILGADPMTAGNSLLFMRDPAKGGVYFPESDEVRRDLREQELPFIRDSILAAPLTQVWSSLRNVARLLVRYDINGRLSDVSYTYEALLEQDNWIGSLNLFRTLPYWRDCVQKPTEICGALDLWKVSALNRITVLLSELILAVWAFHMWRKGRLNAARATDVEFLVALMICGVLANVLVCGVLGGAFDRYQWRVVWLLPMAAASLIWQAQMRLFTRKL